MAADIQRFPTNLATASSPGAMPAGDKAKLDSLSVVSLASKGDIAVGRGGSLAPDVLAAGADRSLLEYDSSQAMGLAKVTPGTLFDRRNAWVASGGLAIDFANGTRQRVQLANGANAITGLLNPKTGTTYVLELLQPSSGAAGTITLAATGTDTVRVSGSLSLSPTNSKANMLILVYDGTTVGAGYFAAFVTGDF